MGAPFKKPRRSYTDEERRAAVVLAMTKGVYAASKELGIPKQTVSEWFNGNRQWRTRAYVEEHKGQLADAFEQLAWELLTEAREKMGEAPLNHIMTGAGIAVDKARILRGEPTNINQNHNANLNLTGLDPSRLTSEQRQALLTLLKAMRREPEPSSEPNPGSIELVGGGDRERGGAGQPPRVLSVGVETGSQSV